MTGPDQLELFLTPEDDGTFQAFIRLMADPAHNPQLRKDATWSANVNLSAPSAVEPTTTNATTAPAATAEEHQNQPRTNPHLPIRGQQRRVTSTTHLAATLDITASPNFCAKVGNHGKSRGN